MFFLIVLSGKVCFSPRTMALLHRHHCQQSSIPLFFLVSLFPKSVTTRLDCYFYWQFFPDPSYFHHISSGGPAALHHFQCGGGKFWSEVWDALPPLQRGPDILVPNEKGVANAEATTGRGWGCQGTARRPPQTRILALMPEPLTQRP